MLWLPVSTRDCNTVTRIPSLKLISGDRSPLCVAMQQDHPFSFTFPRRFLLLLSLFADPPTVLLCSGSLPHKAAAVPAPLASRRHHLDLSRCSVPIPHCISVPLYRLMCFSPGSAALFGRFADDSVLLTVPPPPPYLVLCLPRLEPASHVAVGRSVPQEVPDTCWSVAGSEPS